MKWKSQCLGMSLNPRVLMKSKTRYFPEHSLLQEAITKLMLGWVSARIASLLGMRCQECHSPSQIDSGCFWGQRHPYLVSDRLKPATGPWAAFSQQEPAQGRGNREAVKPGFKRQKGPQRKMGLESVFTHSLDGRIPPILAWLGLSLPCSSLLQCHSPGRLS